MNKITYIVSFMLGAAAGSLLTLKLVEEKYKQIADEEIESVREHYRKKNEDISTIGYCVENDSDIQVAEYKKQVTDLGYVDDDNAVYIEPGVDTIEPYIISPEEYGERDGFDIQSWTYYTNGILTNEDDEIVSDYENIIGNALAHFGEYENDSVFVRNENVECDYEILKVMKPFIEIDEEE